MPALAADEKLIINFDGINWKAEVFVNSQYVGRIDGAFMRSHFDITPYLNKTEGSNVLAVRVIHNENQGEVKIPLLNDPVPNGGALGTDNPTFHASIGWDWIPTMPGRTASEAIPVCHRTRACAVCSVLSIAGHRTTCGACTTSSMAVRSVATSTTNC